MQFSSMRLACTYVVDVRSLSDVMYDIHVCVLRHVPSHMYDLSLCSHSPFKIWFLKPESIDAGCLDPLG